MLGRCGCFVARNPASQAQVGLVTPESTGSMSMIGGRNSVVSEQFCRRTRTFDCLRGQQTRRLQSRWTVHRAGTS